MKRAIKIIRAGSEVSQTRLDEGPSYDLGVILACHLCGLSGSAYAEWSSGAINCPDAASAEKAASALAEVRALDVRRRRSRGAFIMPGLYALLIKYDVLRVYVYGEEAMRRDAVFGYLAERPMRRGSDELLRRLLSGRLECKFAIAPALRLVADDGDPSMERAVQLSVSKQWLYRALESEPSRGIRLISARSEYRRHLTAAVWAGIPVKGENRGPHPLRVERGKICPDIAALAVASVYMCEPALFTMWTAGEAADELSRAILPVFAQEGI